tara:strand:- start:597 stop:755 length:159 start_codon:yes stop_codon:yes gene_type:complete
MLPNISPDTYIYLKVALAGLLATFLTSVYFKTRRKYFKDYGSIKRKKTDKEG